MIPHSPRIARKSVSQLIAEFGLRLQKMGIGCPADDVRAAILHVGVPTNILEEMVASWLEDMRRCNITIVGMPFDEH